MSDADGHFFRNGMGLAFSPCMIRSRPQRISGIVWLPAPPATRAGRIRSALPAALCWMVLLSASLGLLAILNRPAVSRLDILTPFLGHCIGFGLSAAVALSLARRRFTVLALGIAVTIAAHALPAYVAPEEVLPAPAVAVPRGGREIKVMAFNVWSYNEDHAAAVASIAASDADIVLLAELTPDLSHRFEALASLYPFVSACPAEGPCPERVLSRWPIRTSAGLVPANNRPGLAWAEIMLPRGEVITAVAVHVHRPTLGFAQHVTQVRGLIEFLNGIGTRTIVGGDFNVTPQSTSYASITEQAGVLGWRWPLPSWPSVGALPPQFGIDHVLVGPGLAIRAAGVGPHAGSDHRPIWARIALETSEPLRPPPATPSPVANHQTSRAPARNGT